MHSFQWKKMTVIIFLIFAALLFFSCKTTQRFSGNTELTVFIIDENDRPVNDFEIVLKSGAVSVPAVTNKSGLCVFNEITSGDYFIIVNNAGYANSQTKISFVERTEIFCIKVFSSEYVFTQAELLYEKDLYEAAIKLLQELNVGKNQALQNAKSFYLAYGFASINKTREAGIELKKIKAEPPFDDSAQKYKSAIQRMLE